VPTTPRRRFSTGTQRSDVRDADTREKWRETERRVCWISPWHHLRCERYAVIGRSLKHCSCRSAGRKRRNDLIQFELGAKVECNGRLGAWTRARGLHAVVCQCATAVRESRGTTQYHDRVCCVGRSIECSGICTTQSGWTMRRGRERECVCGWVGVCVMEREVVCGGGPGGWVEGG
jgi:hypothetical protein